MSLSVLGVFHIHGPTLLLMLSKAVHGFNLHQSHISGTKLRATSLKVENSSSMCLQPEQKQAEKAWAAFTDLKIKSSIYETTQLPAFQYERGCCTRIHAEWWMIIDQRDAHCLQKLLPVNHRSTSASADSINCVRLTFVNMRKGLYRTGFYRHTYAAYGSLCVCVCVRERVEELRMVDRKQVNADRRSPPKSFRGLLRLVE